MTCPEERLVAFLAGELPPDEEREVDEHLLTCEHCWQAVREARSGQRALGILRAPAPPGLADRIAMAVSLAPGSEPAVPNPAASLGIEAGPAPGARPAAGGARPRRTWRPPAGKPKARLPLGLVAAGLAMIAVLGGAGAFWATRSPGTASPQVDAVVAMMTPTTGPPPVLRAGEHLMIHHQPVAVKAYLVHGEETIVATSSRPFSLPSTFEQVKASSGSAWMTSEGDYSVYGVNRAGGRMSMFLVAAMPMNELPKVAAQLHLS